MTEYRGVIINGREQNGRTYQREDGTFESLDLKDVQPGETITVLTENGAHDLAKTGDKERHSSALEGWMVGATAVRLSLYEHDRSGAQFIHYGIVLRERLGLHVSYPESEQPNVVHNLGTIATILSRKTTEERRAGTEVFVDS
ncbi:MAG TPA: hypothetical protein VL481_01985 [Verrucomicrobiae bacterium]|nr:hypothetical protein [Verrucomicrobiae bacterium]